MSKPKQWKQVREMKHADVWSELAAAQVDLPSDFAAYIAEHKTELYASSYPQEAEQPDRLWVGSGDSQ